MVLGRLRHPLDGSLGPRGRAGTGIGGDEQREQPTCVCTALLEGSGTQALHDHGVRPLEVARLAAGSAVSRDQLLAAIKDVTLAESAIDVTYERTS